MHGPCNTYTSIFATIGWRSRHLVDSNAHVGNRLTRLVQVYFPHSLAPMYAKGTDYLGFLHCSSE